MFKNYFKTAWRTLWQNKFYSAINISGLAIGLAVGIMILFWVQDELNYDGFHHNADNIYKINSHLGTGTSAGVWEGAPAPLAIFSKKSIPEVVNAVRIDNINIELLFTYQDKKFLAPKHSMACVDSTFFSVFDFKLLKGNALHPFQNMNSIIVSASEATRLFGQEDAIGKVLATEFGNFTVTGVMKDFPANSSLHYTMLLPMAFDADYFAKSGGNGDWKTMDEDLGSFSYQIYLQIQNGMSAETVAKKITDIYRSKKGGDSKNEFFTLQPLKTRHLIAADGGDSALQMVRIFLFVAILILLIACINYINLSTARSMIRSKEVSVRKIIGAARQQLFIQFIIESAVLFLFAAALAYLVIYLLFPVYNELSGKRMEFSLTNKNVWMATGAAVIGTLLMSGVYPAMLLSSFKPLEALKGKLSSGIRNTSFRKILVVTQFTFSVGLIIATIVINRQLHYIRSKDLGYNKEHVFTVRLKDKLQNHYEAVRSELLKQPGVLSAATADNSVVGAFSSTADTYWEGKEPDRMFLIRPNGIDRNFIPLLEMKLVAGSNFTGSKSDSAHVILNETAVKETGIKDPIGKTFTLWQTKATIIGVVKDFNYASLKEAIKPAIFFYKPSGGLLYIKTTGRDAAKAIAAAEKVWKQYTPDLPFSYSFLDDDYNRMYQSDLRTGLLFKAFAAIAILISCLGLFGLATYTAQVKTKEIGIRKVLGASVASITNLLTKEFIVPVLIALAIASPLAWIGMNKWLQHYAYRASISWWIFLAAGLLAVLIALITVSFQAIKAAIANPVKSLKTE